MSGGRARSIAQVLLAIAILVAIALGADALARALHSPIPGNVLGMVFLFVLLSVGAIPRAWVDRGADLLLAHLALFFLPPAVAVLRYRGLLARAPLAIAIAIVPITLVVLAVVGLLAQSIARAAEKKPSR